MCQVVYSELREELLRSVTDNLSLDEIKAEFREVIRSRRRYERISSLEDLLLELENRLVIFPDKRGINSFLSIVRQIQRIQSQSLRCKALVIINCNDPRMFVYSPELVKRVEARAAEWKPLPASTQAGRHRQVTQQEDGTNIEVGMRVLFLDS